MGIYNGKRINIAGLIGKSSYQVAVDNGFTGTEEEWLASLKADYSEEIAEISTKVDTEIFEYYKKSICDFIGFMAINKGTTTIAAGAYQYDYKIKTVYIPNSVTSIGEWAFNGCYSLESVTFENDSKLTSIGDYAFESCSSLTSINIPASVTSIGDYAFESCISLTSINIPASVTSIGNYAFSSCGSLTSINIPASVTSIGEWAFCYTDLKVVTFENDSQLTSIGNYAFYSCSSLGVIDFRNVDFIPTLSTSDIFYDVPTTCKVIIPDDLYDTWTTSTNWSALSVTYVKASELTVIPYGTKTIRSSAYRNDDTIRGIYIPESVTSIGDYAFYGCSSLTSITIPESVTYIGKETFRNSSLTSITFEENSKLKSIADSTFRGCTGLTSITFEENSQLTSIGKNMCSGCSSLTSINIPEKVTSIGEWAFSNCKSLTSITIPESVTSIGDYAFYGCSSLTSINIPESVTSIGGETFSRCSKLDVVDFSNHTSVPTLSNRNVFYDVPTTCKVIIPDDLYDTWTTSTNWSALTITYVKASEYTEEI